MKEKGNVEMNDIEKKLEALKVDFLGKLEALEKEAEMQKKQEEPKPWKPEHGEKYFTIENGVDVVYREERLNEIMSEFNKQMKKKDELEKERHRDMVEEMIKDNKVEKYENDDNPDSKVKLSIKEKMEKINKMEIDKSKVNIDKIDSDIAKLKDAINKMHKE